MKTSSLGMLKFLRTRLGLIPPVQFLLAAGLMAALDRWLPLASIKLPFQNQVFSIFLLLGLLLAASALIRFHRMHTTHSPIAIEKASHLVTHGIYQFTRNPMYLGLLFILFGWGYKLGTLFPFAVLPLFVLSITVLQIQPEEAVLREKFGAEYNDYCQRVRRWI